VWVAPVVLAVARRDAPSMTITPSTSQRDLVRLAVLMCGERPSAKSSKPVKGTQNSRNEDPTRGFSR
jgi:hypothetical protein